MSWHYLQEGGAASWEGGSLDGAPDALLKLMPMHGGCSWRDSGTDAWSRSRSGMMFAHLTGGHGAGPSISSQEDFPARISARQGEGLESPGSDPDSGERWPGSLARWDRDSSSWRTHQFSLLGGLELFSGTWPRWGMMRAGECWAQSTPGLHISGSGSGLWPTPKSAAAGPDFAKMERSGTGISLQTAVAMWPTPQAHDCHKGNAARVGRYGTKHSGRNLNDEVAMFPTPRSSDGERGGRGDLIQAVRGNENSHFKLWQTPVADDAVERKAGKINSRGEPKLSAQVLMVATPTARDWRSGKASEATHAKNSRPLSEQIGGSLNPTWVEWLMGWPLGWTDCEPSGTDRFRQWSRSHGGH
jgi:hypothetical protein